MVVEGDRRGNAEEESGACERKREDVVHLPFPGGGTIKIKLENKREAGSYYKVF